jgi:hypothetical protein
MSGNFPYHDSQDDFFENGHVEGPPSYFGQTLFPPARVESHNINRTLSSSSDCYFGADQRAARNMWGSLSFESNQMESAVPYSHRRYLQAPPPPPYQYMHPPPPTQPGGYQHSYHHPYHHYPGAPYWHHQRQQAPHVAVDYITDIRSDDVLSGRGGATNSHKGNRKFRVLVKKHQPEYLRAKKRDKPAVAGMVVDLVRKEGGRFLRRWDTTVDGHVLWTDIGDERAREKTCQALREGAPELRRHRKREPVLLDADDTESKPSSPDSKATADINTALLSSQPTLNVSRYGDDVLSESSTPAGRPDGPSGMNITIRPIVQLLRDRSIDPIPLDQLTSDDRDLYLGDFWPPTFISSKAFSRCHSDSTCEVDPRTSGTTSPRVHA